MRAYPMVMLLAVCLTAFHGAAPGSASPAADGAARAVLYSPQDVRADLRHMYDGLRRAHFNLFENVARENYDRLFDQMMAEVTSPEDRSAVARRLQRFAAFGRIAHARVDSAGEEFGDWRAAGGRYFPLSIRFDGHRAFVLENRSGLDEPPEGAEILTLQGETMGVWFDRVRRHVAADTDYFASALLEFQFPGLLWFELGHPPAFHVTWRKGDDLRSTSIPARTQAEQRAVQRPPGLRSDRDARSARVIEPGVAYLRPGPFYNMAAGAADIYDNRAFVAFVDKAMKEFNKAGARALIIDIRGNPGGDSSFSDHLLGWFADRPFRFVSSLEIKVSPETTASNAARLSASVDPEGSISARMAALYQQSRDGDIVRLQMPEAKPRRGERFRGRVYLLVDRHSYSNAANVAAIVQDYRFGTVVGEETADFATTLGAMESFTLPNTGIVVGYPKARLVRPSGSPVRRGVVPDIMLDFPVVQDASDPVLRQVVELTRTKSVERRSR